MRLSRIESDNKASTCYVFLTSHKYHGISSVQLLNASFHFVSILNHIKGKQTLQSSLREMGYVIGTRPCCHNNTSLVSRVLSTKPDKLDSGTRLTNRHRALLHRSSYHCLCIFQVFLRLRGFMCFNNNNQREADLPFYMYMFQKCRFLRFYYV